MTHTTDANDRMNRPLDGVDPQIADLLREEARRQATGLELIPSENLVSEADLDSFESGILRLTELFSFGHVQRKNHRTDALDETIPRGLLRGRA